MAAPASAPPRPSLPTRVLGIVTEVRPGEAATASLLTLQVFLLLTAYYLIKPVREALILSLESGAEYKAYMSGAIAVALLFAVPAYAKVADRLPRNRLVVGVTLFFASNLGLFYLASLYAPARPYLGPVFFVWVGTFNMMVVAQFWAFANDLYREEQGRRLFVLLGLGQAFGAMAGAAAAREIVAWLGVYQMLLLSGALLVAFALLAQVVHAREARRAAAGEGASPREVAAPATAAPLPRGAFGLVFGVRYLLLLALFSLLFTWVNTNGEYVLGKLVGGAADAAVRAGEMTEEESRRWIGGRFAEFYLYVNVLTFVLQTFVVSRVVKHGGLRVAFLVFPVVALLDATASSLLPILAVVFVGKVAENGTDYSFNNTVRNILWLPTSSEMKYKAKQAVDSFFVRLGDVSSALLVALLAGLLGVGVRAFAVANVLLVLAWIWLAVQILREHRRLVASGAPDAAPDLPP